MKKAEFEALKNKIVKGVKSAITSLYKEAKKNGWELVISENGKVKKIKPA